MYLVHSYPLAVALCVVTMLCWGSWANTQKLTGRWRFELFYWDYVFGVMLLATVAAFTAGSLGTDGRGFLADVRQAAVGSLVSALLGGLVFNLANIMLVAAIDLAGMAVAFPVGIGLALVVGVIENQVAQPKGNTALIAVGVVLIAVAIVIDALAYRRLPGQGQGVSTKGLVLSVLCGLLMGSFYWLVKRSMSESLVELEPGKLGPYAAVFFFCLGILGSNLVFNHFIMARPINGAPVGWADYFQGTGRQHMLGIVGGVIWCIGTLLNIVASGVAGSAISYGLGQGATMIAAAWGVFVWREFRTAPPGTGRLLVLMFVSFLVGLSLLIVAGA